MDKTDERVQEGRYLAVLFRCADHVGISGEDPTSWSVVAGLGTRTDRLCDLALGAAAEQCLKTRFPKQAGAVPHVGQEEAQELSSLVRLLVAKGELSVMRAPQVGFRAALPSCSLAKGCATPVEALRALAERAEQGTGATEAEPERP